MFLCAYFPFEYLLWWGNCSNLHNLKLGCSFPYCWVFKSNLYILDNIPYQISLLQIFFHLWLVLSFPTVPFEESILILINSKLSKFFMKFFMHYLKLTLNLSFEGLFFQELVHYYYFFLICSKFCHTLKWNGLEFTCLPHPIPPSHLPLHPLPPGPLFFTEFFFFILFSEFSEFYGLHFQP